MKLAFWKKADAAGADSMSANILRFGGVGEEVASDVAEAGFPGYAQELLDPLRDRAVAQVEAAAALPIDREAARSDGWLLDERERLLTQAEAASSKHEAAAARLEDREKRLAALPKPIGIFGWFMAVSALALVVGVGVPTLAGLLTSSIDGFVIRPYVASVLNADAERFSAQVSFLLGLGLAGFILGGQALAVLATRGRIGWFWKTVIVLGETIIAGAFAVMRLRHGGTLTMQALSVSLLEIGATLLSTAIIMAVGNRLQADSPKVEPYRVARAERRAAKKALKRAVREHEERSSVRAAHEARIAEREEAVRRREAHRTLALASTDVTYAVATAKAVGEAAKTPAADTAASEVERHLGNEFKREEKRREANVGSR